MILSNKRKTKVLIKLCRCVGLPAPLLIASTLLLPSRKAHIFLQLSDMRSAPGIHTVSVSVSSHLLVRGVIGSLDITRYKPDKHRPHNIRVMYSIYKEVKLANG